MIDYSLIQLVHADESHREFSYQVKIAAEGEYIVQLFGWNEPVQRRFHTEAWQRQRPDIISYKGKFIGTISTIESEDSIEIGQFFILPEYQNKGIGTYLLQQILDKADQLGVITKLAYLTNDRVGSLYARNGFQIVKTNNTHCFAERKPKHRG